MRPRQNNKIAEPAPFSGSSNARSFYSNLARREALATLRFGIEARKALILFTGEAGVGKTTLFHKLTRELDEKVSCILLSDPHLSVAEIVKCILRHFQIQSDSEDEAALIQECITVLRSHAQTDRITALVFDNAHHLDDRTLECVIKQFSGIARSQVLLVGRPALKEKLLKPRLRSLGSQAGIDCQLHPFNHEEVFHYIEHRLQGSHLPEDLFERDALQCIAIYSTGVPRLVDTICDRALQIADRSLGKRINSAIIDSAARDLNLRQPPSKGENNHEASFAIPEEQVKPFHFQGAQDDASELVGHTFLSYRGSSDRKGQYGSRGRFAAIRSVLLISLILGAAGAAVQFEPARSYLGEWIENLKESTGLHQPIHAQVDSSTGTPAQTKPPPVTTAPTSEPQRAMASNETDEVPEPTDTETKEFTAPSAPIPTKERVPAKLEPPPKTPPGMRPGRSGSPQEIREKSGRDLAIDISKAIDNRAIAGVSVSVVDNIAYLDGRVASEAQRRVAEQAARNVPQIVAVSNRIVVD